MKLQGGCAFAIHRLVSDLPQTKVEDLEALLPEVNMIMSRADAATEQAMRALIGHIEKSPIKDGFQK